MPGLLLLLFAASSAAQATVALCAVVGLYISYFPPLSPPLFFSFHASPFDYFYVLFHFVYFSLCFCLCPSFLEEDLFLIPPPPLSKWSLSRSRTPIRPRDWRFLWFSRVLFWIFLSLVPDHISFVAQLPPPHFSFGLTQMLSKRCLPKKNTYVVANLIICQHVIAMRWSSYLHFWCCNVLRGFFLFVAFRGQFWLCIAQLCTQGLSSRVIERVGTGPYLASVVSNFPQDESFSFKNFLRGEWNVERSSVTLTTSEKVPISTGTYMFEPEEETGNIVGSYSPR